MGVLGSPNTHEKYLQQLCWECHLSLQGSIFISEFLRKTKSNQAIKSIHPFFPHRSWMPCHHCQTMPEYGMSLSPQINVTQHKKGNLCSVFCRDATRHSSMADHHESICASQPYHDSYTNLHYHYSFLCSKMIAMGK